jgi:hypothetical protein
MLPGKAALGAQVDETTPDCPSDGGGTAATKRAYICTSCAQTLHQEGAMQAKAAVLVHPAVLRTPWHVALAIAAADVSKHVALTIAIAIGGAMAATLMLLLAVVCAPLCVALLAWVLWRSSHDAARDVRRSLARARRRARALGLRVVRS